MALYQPQQNLTWKYIINTGQLYIVSNISLELEAGERVNHSVTLALNNTFLVSLNVVSGTNNSPLVIDISYTTITSGLTDVDQVRQLIAGLASATVQATVYKNGMIMGVVENKSTSQAIIELN